VKPMVPVAVSFVPEEKANNASPRNLPSPRGMVSPRNSSTAPSPAQTPDPKKDPPWEYSKFADDSKPKLRDLQRDITLGKWIEANIEVDDEAQQVVRQRVYEEVEATVHEWVQHCLAAKGLSGVAGVSIHVAGSHRLGLHEPENDIDMVAVCSTHVDPIDFFEELTAIFEEMEDKVTNMVSVPEALVPIMEFMYEGVRINLMFAQLPIMEVPPTLDISDDHILQGVEVESVVMSLNGPRTTELIIDLVPKYDTFIKVLKCVRKWAKRRGLYSNKIGFLGGVNWAILTAFVCKLHPNQTAASVLHKFFWWMKQWSWPKPITIRNVDDVGLGHNMWYHDGQEMMPIITPAYPTFNSSYNVCYSTLQTMKREFNLAFARANLVMKDENTSWDHLFEPSDFFSRHEFYLRVTIIAGEEESFTSWAGWVESRLRKLVMSLEHYAFLDNIAPYHKGFRSDEDEWTQYHFIGFDCDLEAMYAEDAYEYVSESKEEPTPEEGNADDGGGAAVAANTAIRDGEEVAEGKEPEAEQVTPTLMGQEGNDVTPGPDTAAETELEEKTEEKDPIEEVNWKIGYCEYFMENEVYWWAKRTEDMEIACAVIWAEDLPQKCKEVNGKPQNTKTRDAQSADEKAAGSSATDMKDKAEVLSTTQEKAKPSVKAIPEAKPKPSPVEDKDKAKAKDKDKDKTKVKDKAEPPAKKAKVSTGDSEKTSRTSTPVSKKPRPAPGASETARGPAGSTPTSAGGTPKGRLISLSGIHTPSGSDQKKGKWPDTDVPKKGRIISLAGVSTTPSSKPPIPSPSLRSRILTPSSDRPRIPTASSAERARPSVASGAPKRTLTPGGRTSPTERVRPAAPYTAGGAESRRATANIAERARPSAGGAERVRALAAGAERVRAMAGGVLKRPAGAEKGGEKEKADKGLKGGAKGAKGSEKGGKGVVRRRPVIRRGEGVYLPPSKRKAQESVQKGEPAKKAKLT